MGFWVMIAFLIFGMILIYNGFKKRSPKETVNQSSMVLGFLLILAGILLGWPK